MGAPQAAARNVDMPAPAMPHPSTDRAVLANERALRQALFTLLGWALQHRPRGSELRVQILARDGTRGVDIHHGARVLETGLPTLFQPADGSALLAPMHCRMAAAGAPKGVRVRLQIHDRQAGGFSRPLPAAVPPVETAAARCPISRCSFRRYVDCRFGAWRSPCLNS